METAFSVFINGTAGVFAAMGVLYVTVKINAWLAGKAPQTEEE
jgi:hypothetical protein